MRKKIALMLSVVFILSFAFAWLGSATVEAGKCWTKCEGLKGFKCCRVQGQIVCLYDPNIDCVVPI